ncbi:DNA polymerase III subunit alpha [Coprothermobacteraceae bacterium]|nr:DNA polymerase III subunit alpha [Coprothermobacteraceae bacterium]
MEKQFVHLHVHSAYSLLDGVTKPTKLVEQAKRLGMQALALTDHGVTYGLVEFVDAARKNGIKPIVGVEGYQAPRDRHSKDGKKDQEPFHLVLLVKNAQGFKNLNILITKAYLEGFYYRPRFDWDLLSKYHEGLIATSACLAGAISRAILEGDEKRAIEWAGRYQDIFGPGNFFLELMDHGMPEQRRANTGILEVAKKTKIPLIATNDVHYSTPEGAFVQDVLMAISTGATLNDPNRFKYETDQMYLKSSEEMERLFWEVPEALSNTLTVAEMVEFELALGQQHLPKFPVPAGYDENSYLRHLAMLGLAKRYGTNPPEEVLERTEYELSVIERMGFAGYFLIVQDYINWAKSNGIPVGPGRGSAAGSLVAYLLGITDVDPLKYGLLFERFLNPERISMPDIDVDFCARRRDEVLQYVRQRYGEENVAQIVTFGTLAARAAVRDVGRVLGVPLSYVDRLSKSIPQNMDLEEAAALDEVKSLVRQFPDLARVLEVAKQVEGLPRHASTHAAGVVISDKPLYEYVALQTSSDEAGINVTTQLAKDDVEKLGLLKMDFLGLRNMTVINDTLRWVKERHGLDIDLARIPMDDPNVYQMLSAGETIGVFQLESSGFRSFLRELKPSRFEEIIAAEALYRPGTLGSGGVRSFVDRKHGREPIDYFHPDLKPILDETYGIIVYQEQIMQIASVIAGYSLGEADVLRRAISKKKEEEILKLRDDFVKRGTERGYPREVVERIYETIVHFAEYGFNKSHSAAYAHVTYYTAWLKYYYPTEYFAALLASFVGNTEKLRTYVAEAKRLGIVMLPPDINKSYHYFVPEGEKAIRFGLLGIKNVGIAAVEEVIRVREESGPFASLADFLSRVSERTVNKKVVESLIRAGAFDSLGDRKMLLRHLATGGTGQSLFQIHEDPGEEMINLDPLHDEKEYLGFYITTHPLEKYMRLLEGRDLVTLDRVDEATGLVRVGGLVTGTRVRRSRNNNPYMVFTLEDLTSQVEVMVLPQRYDDFKVLAADSGIAIFQARPEAEEERSRLIAESLESFMPLRELEDRLKDLNGKGVLEVVVGSHQITLERLKQLRRLIETHRGITPIEFAVHLDGSIFRIMLPNTYWVNVDSAFEKALFEILSPMNVHFRRLNG